MCVIVDSIYRTLFTLAVLISKMPKNRKIYYTTQELAQMNIDDTIQQQKLDKLANDAIKEDKLEPYRNSLSIAQNSMIDTKTSRLNATDMEIRAKLE